MFWWLFILVTGLKLLLMPAYRSTDFEVHRNWMAITHSLPISRWYLEDTSEWTLDYPPFFAFFEWALSHIANYFDPKMLLLQNLNYGSEQTVVFQRLSVIFTDLVFAFGIRKCLNALNLKESLQGFAGEVYLLANVGLIFVDHVHFQYNGFLFGILLLSIGFLLEEKYVRSAIVFAALLNFKHIFLYMSPAFGAFFLKFFCIKDRSFLVLNFISLLVAGGSSFLLSLSPFFNQLPQVFSRLFPFKRGLTHSYWAPNFWAIYNSVDKVAEVGLRIKRQGGTNTAGLVQEYRHVFLPIVSPSTTFILTLGFMMPCVIKLLFFTEKKNSKKMFLRAVVICSCTSFMFGWHVHEKAIIMSLVPLGLLALTDEDEARYTLLLSVIGNFSLFPLLFNRELLLIKFSLFVAYISVIFCLFKSIHRNMKFHLHELIYILGLTCLPFNEYVLSPFLKFDQKLPYLPLLLTSLYCSFGILYIFINYYYLFLTDNRNNTKSKPVRTKLKSK